MAQRNSGHRNPARKGSGVTSLVKTIPTGKGVSSLKIGRGKKIPKFTAIVSKPSLPPNIRRISKEEYNELITYVLDTNVIMDAWDAIFQFEEHEVCIVSQVWQELDDNKKGLSEINWNVRKVTRVIDALVAGKTPKELSEGVILVPPAEIQNGKPHTGRLIFDFSTPKVPEGLDIELNPDQPDDRIIMACLSLQKRGKRVVLISNDGNCRVRALVAGVISEEYLNEALTSLPSEEDTTTGFHVMTDNFWEKIGSNFTLEKRNGFDVYDFSHAMFKNVYCNEFLVLPNDLHLRVTEKPSPHKIVARTFNCKSYKGTVEPRNIEQKFALELLFDTDLPAVSLGGLAGSGKTYLALALAFHLTMEKKAYDRVIFTRSPEDSDKPIGFLPGDEEEKMSPWLGSVTDNLEAFLHIGDSKNRMSTVAHIKERMNLQIKSLNLMKGRSFENTLIVVDEVQDITRKTLKMIATRVGTGSKIVFLGNVAQIDNRFITEHTCGMSVLIRTFMDSSNFGHITLQRGERSVFATEAEQRL